MSNAISLRVVLIYNALVFALLGFMVMFGGSLFDIIRDSDYARLIGIFYLFLGIISYQNYKFFTFSERGRLILLTMLCLNVILAFSYFSIFQLESPFALAMCIMHFFLAVLFVIYYWRMKKLMITTNS